MSLYEYRCKICGHRFEIRHGADEKPELCCPECEGEVCKIFFPTGIIFKGTGWHITDYAPKRKTDESFEEKKAASDEKKAASEEKKAASEEKKPAGKETAASAK